MSRVDVIETERREALFRRAIARRARSHAILVALSAVLVVTGVAALGVGAVSTPLGEVLAALGRPFGLSPSDAMHETVVLSLRLPRVLFGMLVGATLAVAGGALQGIFRNPLADPGLIGVSSGAALAVGLVLVLPVPAWLSLPWAQGAVPIAGFVGGLVATITVYRLATSEGRTQTATMLLAGIAINAFCGAGLGLLIYLSDDTQLRDLTMWTLGGLGGASWRVLAVSAPLGLVALAGLLANRRALNAMLLGESEAFHMGQNADAIKRRIVFFAALAVGSTVGFAGMIGFVGLVVPHLLRLFGGADHRFVLPGAALLGAALLVGADALARTVVAPAELPIGVITALMGAPFFLFLLLRQQRRFV